MEQIATPGSILVTADSLRLAEGYLEVRPLGPVSVRGLAMSVEVFEVIGAGHVRSRLQAAAARGLTRFVGRGAEMAVLRDALSGAGAGQGQVVALVGEVGVGKSRLLHEFIRSRDTRGWRVLESNSVSYGRTTPYLPVIEFLKSYFEIDSRDDARMIREKVSARVLKVDQSLQDAIPPVLDLLEALPDDHAFRTLEPLQRRQQTATGITRLLLSESRVQPVVAVFEDLHWNDSLTLGLLKGLIASLSDVRMLLLVSYRPEYRDDWKTRARYRQLRVEPLPRESVEELLHDLLGAEQGLAALKGFLIERTGGNPFFVEEIVRTLVETDVLIGARGDWRLARPYSSVQVPATVQAVLASRVDRLPPEDKLLLQEAAVIGKDVPFALLHAIAGLPEEELRSRLANLQSAEFFYETRLFPDLEYTFKHSLTQEVAYAGLLHARRREIHARIVAAMEDLYANRMAEQIERLAHHARLGELWSKALPYLRQAGAKAAERPAYREAFTLLEQALEVLTHLPESRDSLEQAIDIRFDIRNVLQPLGEHDRIAGFLREAERLAARLDDPRRVGWIQSYLADHYWMLGRTEEAATAGERALGIARQLSELPLQVVTNLPLGLLHHTRGDFRAAMRYFEWNVARLEGELLHERFGLFVLPSSFSRSFLAWSFAELGEFAKGAAVGEEGVRIAESADHSFSCGYAYLGMGVLHLRQGDLPRAIFALQRALAVGAFANIPVGYAYVAFHLGYALALSGRSAEGVPMLEKTVALAESRGFVARHSLRLAYLGEAYLLTGRIADAAAVAARALALAREHNERGNQAFALRVLGEVDAHRGEAAAAQAQFRAALELAAELEMRPLLAHCHHGLAGALEAAGQDAAGKSHRESAAALFRFMDMRIPGERLEVEPASSN
jgi:tetratricopeptide (TPR) repeat protein